MNNKVRIAFIAIVVVQVVFLIGMIGMKQWNLTHGEKILLKVVPVDPRDIFRGDYVILNYDGLSRINTASVAVEENTYFYPNTKVIVKLQKQDKYWIAKSIEQKGDWRSKLKKDNSNELFIKGDVVQAIGMGRNPNYYTGNMFLTIEYGIENYFVPEGEGKEIEKAARDGTLSVEVSVDRSSGEAIISKLYINDQPIEFKRKK